MDHFFSFFLLYNIVFVLPYINMNPPRVYTCSSSWTPLPIPSLWVIPVHQPQVSCILHWTWTGDSFLIWYYTCFDAILPNHPPSTESKRLFYTSVYLLLSLIQGCRYHLYWMHSFIEYALFYAWCITVTWKKQQETRQSWSLLSCNLHSNGKTHKCS